MKIDDIQKQINNLQQQLDSLKQQKEFTWDDAPTIVQIDGEKWLLGPESDEEMDWEDAKAWCESVGGELPPRDILLHCFMKKEINILFTATYYWSSTEFTATNAWIQKFGYGNQGGSLKAGAHYVRAVRRLPI